MSRQEFSARVVGVEGNRIILEAGTATWVDRKKKKGAVERVFSWIAGGSVPDGFVGRPAKVFIRGGGGG